MTGEPEPYEPPTIDRGTLVGRYVVLSELGRGGMGTVFEAFDPDLDRRVALKVVTPREQERREDLGREARVLAKLEHPNVATVYDVGFWEDRLFIAMELVDGGDLEAWLRPGRTTAEILEVYRQAGRGLAAAHERGIVHRDFKPSNVLVGTDGRARVADFGIARVDTGLVSSLDAGDSMRGLVDSGSTTGGTPDFMAPEVTDGARADSQSDQYSFCVALYWSLSGQLPEPGAIDELNAPAAVRRAIARGLSPDPHERFDSMDAMLLALRPKDAPRRSGLAAGLVLAVAGTTFAAFAASRPPGDADGCSERTNSWEQAYPDSRFEALDQHLASASSAHAQATAARVVGALGELHREWGEQFSSVCAVPEHEAARACLTERRLEFDAMWSALESGEPSVVEHAMDAVYRMGRPASCTDPEYPAPVPVSPAGPDDEVAGEGIRGHLRRAQALQRTSQNEPAMQEATRALEWAESIDHLPLRAEALLLQGRVYDSLGDFRASEQAVRRAFMAAWSSGHDTIAISAAAVLLDVVGAESGDEDEGGLWLELGEAAIARLGWPTLEEAELWDAAGSLASTQGQMAEARAYHERALERRGRFVPLEHPDQATSYYSLASIELEDGAFEEALRLSEQALELRRKALGDEHPEVALAHNTVGVALLKLARYEEAEQTLEHAYALGLEVLGPDHPRFASVRNNLANVLNRRKEHARAKALYEESLEVWSRTRGDDDPDIALAHHNIAATALMMGDIAGSIEHEREAIRIWSEALGDDHPRIATALFGLAGTLRDAGKCEEALEPARRAVELVEGSHQPGRRRLPATLHQLSRVLRCLERFEEAAAASRRAVSTARESLGHEHPNTGPMLAQLAASELLAGSLDRAGKAAEDALAVGVGGDAQRQMSFVLARSVVVDDPERARSLALQAIDPALNDSAPDQSLKDLVQTFVEDLGEATPSK